MYKFLVFKGIGLVIPFLLLLAGTGLQSTSFGQDEMTFLPSADTVEILSVDKPADRFLSDYQQKMWIVKNKLIGPILPLEVYVNRTVAADYVPTLTLLKKEKIDAEHGVKSVLLSPDKKKVYAMNLEGMSIYEYDRETRKLLRHIEFDKTPAYGWDYSRGVKINSYAEKPVEGCFSHNGRFLWVSLHNADGIVVWDLEGGESYVEGKDFYKATLFDYRSGTKEKERVRLLFFETGKTPKVMASTPDSRYLFVANWHSYNVSAMDIHGYDRGRWHIEKDIEFGIIPRGLSFSFDYEYLYVALMGGSEIAKVSIDSLETIEKFNVGRGPRHLITAGDKLFLSSNSLSKIMRIDANTNEIDASSTTMRAPRTIQVSEDGSVIFLTAYYGEHLQAFASATLESLGNWQSPTHPVGVDVYQEDDIVEVWVCNYSSGDINIFTFRISKD